MSTITGSLKLTTGMSSSTGPPEYTAAPSAPSVPAGGVGVPAGGAAGQVLTKTTVADFAVGWHTLVWFGTQAQFDALPTKDPTCLYAII